MLTFPKIKLPACKSNPPVTLRNEAPQKAGMIFILLCGDERMGEAAELRTFTKDNLLDRPLKSNCETEGERGGRRKQKGMKREGKAAKRTAM